MTRKFGTANGDTNARACACDGPDQMTTQKAGAAIDGHKRPIVQSDGHVDAS